MSITGDNEDTSKSPANVVGIGAKPVGSTANIPADRYPVEWMDLCREILVEYQQALADQFGEEITLGQVRDRIMREFDIYEDNKRIERDGRLRRQDVEHYINNSTYPNPHKFKFIDKFIREETLKENSLIGQSRIKLIIMNEKTQLESFKKGYFPKRQRQTEALHDCVEIYTEKLFVLDSQHIKEGSDSFALYVKNREHGLFRVVAFNYTTDITTPYELISKSVIYHGCFVPMLQTNSDLLGNAVVGMCHLSHGRVNASSDINNLISSVTKIRLANMRCDQGTGRVDCMTVRSLSDTKFDIRWGFAIDHRPNGYLVNLNKDRNSGQSNPNLYPMNIEPHHIDLLNNLHNDYMLW
ncbi:hypothetical protein ACR9YC_02120 [Parasphingorhabdus sp. DH2-15]|uniref:hypothetical protein n=1 Tax=Parasphingorhabdus sp. DH2-15 TaxID=3444112 RepID=UPI003F682A1B